MMKLIYHRVWEGHRRDWIDGYKLRMAAFLLSLPKHPCFVGMKLMVEFGHRMEKLGYFQPVPYYWWTIGVQVIIEEFLSWYSPVIRWTCTEYDRKHCPDSHLQECRGEGAEMVWK